jgi:microcystin-dependent protein
MKKHYVSALAALTITTSAFACSGTGMEYIGSICVTAATFCPAYATVEANGQLLSVQSNSTLFSLYGVTYGGDGRTSFGVPDLRGRTPVGLGTGKDNSGTNNLSTVTLGQKRGQESVTLTANNLSAHTHPFVPTTGNQNVTIPATTGSGTTLSGKVGVVPDTANTAGDMTPSAGTTYQLAGTVASNSKTVTGPYTNASLPASSAYVSGVSVDASGMTPNIPAKTVTVQTVTGGAVGVYPMSAYPIATVSPQLGLRYCIVTQGMYPSKD